MNPDYMCIEEGPNPLPFHSKFEADFWESVSQSNNTVNTHFGSQASTGDSDGEDLEMSSVYKDGKMELFTEGVSEKIFYSKI